MPTAKISSPLAETVKLLYNVNEGGTGATNLTQAAQNLNLLLYSDIGNGPGQVPLLNSQSQLPVQFTQPVQQNSSQSSGLSGPSSGYVGQDLVFLITDYDSFSTYTVSVSAGTFVRNLDTITYTAPASAGTYTLTINSKSYSIVVNGASVSSPSITSPLNNTSEQPSNVTLVGSAFAVSGASDTHEGTDWQISTDPNFSTLFASTVNSPTEKTSFSVSNLSASTTYYVRVRYKGAVLGYSSWSTVVRFGTQGAWTQVSQLVAADAVSTDRFGSKAVISKDGSTIAAVSQWNTNGVITGALYIFVKDVNSNWIQQAKVTQSDTVASVLLGAALSISDDGNTVACGTLENTSAGSVYIFVRNGTTWTQEAKIAPANLSQSDGFGEAVALDGTGNLLVVGAKIAGATSNYSLKGVVFLYYRYQGVWSAPTTTVPADGVDGDRFGTSVAFSSDGNTVAVGSVGQSPNFGAIYVYSRSGTTLIQDAKLLEVTNTGSASFGKSVSLSGDGTVLIAGSTAKIVSGFGNSGSVCIFRKTSGTWGAGTEIVNPSALITGDSFGASVAVSGNGSVVAIGATGDDAPFTNNGTTYIYGYASGSWTHKSILIASDAAAQDQFGIACSLTADGMTCVVGASMDDAPLTNSGSVYVFKTTQSSGFLPLTEVAILQHVGGYPTSTNNQYMCITAAGDRLASFTSTGGMQIWKETLGNWSIEQSFSGYDYVSQGGLSFDSGGNYLFVTKGNSSNQYVVEVFKRTGTVWSLENTINPSTLSLTGFNGPAYPTIDGMFFTISSGSQLNASVRANILKKVGTSWSVYGGLNGRGIDAADSFGSKMALSGDTEWLAISAESEDHAGPTNNGTLKANAGSVQFFKKFLSGTDVSYVSNGIAVAPDYAVGDYFGRLTALDHTGTRCVAMSTFSAKIYCFVRTGVAWAFENMLPVVGSLFTIDSTMTGNMAGGLENSNLKLSNDGTYAYLSVPRFNNPNIVGGTGTDGAVFVWKRTGTTWAQENILYCNTAIADEFFGTSIALNQTSDRLFVSNARYGNNHVRVYE